MRERVGRLVGLAPLLLALGCTWQAPLERWRLDAQQYIAERSTDANLLRTCADLTSSPDERPALLRFGTLRVPAGWGVSYDVLGVLVGIAPMPADRWYVFLVATARVRAGGGYPETTAAITDVRIIGLWLRDGTFDWLVGAAAPAPTRRYLAARADTLADESGHMLFPGPTDVFALEVSGPDISVTERTSGARWMISILRK